MDLREIELKVKNEIESFFHTKQDEFYQQVANTIAGKLEIIQNKIEKETTEHMAQNAKLEITAILDDLLTEIETLKNEMLEDVIKRLNKEKKNVSSFIEEYKGTIDAKMSLSLEQLNGNLQTSIQEINEIYNNALQIINSAEKTGVNNIELKLAELKTQLVSDQKTLKDELKNQYGILTEKLQQTEIETLKKINALEQKIRTKLDSDVAAIVQQVLKYKDSIKEEMRLYEVQLEDELSKKKNKLIAEIEVDKQDLLNSMTARKDELLVIIDKERVNQSGKILQKGNEVFSNLVASINGHEQEFQQMNSENVNKFISEIKIVYDQAKLAFLTMFDLVKQRVNAVGDEKNNLLTEKYTEYNRTLEEKRSTSVRELENKKKEITSFLGENKTNGHWKIILDSLNESLENSKRSLNELKEQIIATTLSAKTEAEEYLKTCKEKAVQAIGTENSSMDGNKPSARKSAIDAVEAYKQKTFQEMDGNKDRLVENAVREMVAKEEESSKRVAEKSILQLEKYLSTIQPQFFSEELQNKSEIQLPRDFKSNDRMFVFLNGTLLSKNKDYTFEPNTKKITLKQGNKSGSFVAYELYPNISSTLLTFKFEGTRIGIKHSGDPDSAYQYYDFDDGGITDLCKKEYEKTKTLSDTVERVIQQAAEGGKASSVGGLTADNIKKLSNLIVGNSFMKTLTEAQSEGDSAVGKVYQDEHKILLCLSKPDSTKKTDDPEFLKAFLDISNTSLHNSLKELEKKLDEFAKNLGQNEQIQALQKKILEELPTLYEPIIKDKKTGFNLEKSDSVSLSFSDSLATSLAVSTVNQTLTTLSEKVTQFIEHQFVDSSSKKLDKGNYRGTAEDLKKEIDGKVDIKNISHDINSDSTVTVASSKAIKTVKTASDNVETKLIQLQDSTEKNYMEARRSIQVVQGQIQNLETRKENVIAKNTGFNLNKSNDVNSERQDVLATSYAVKLAMDKANSAYQLAGTKMNNLTPKTGFNLDTSNNYQGRSEYKLATEKAVGDLYFYSQDKMLGIERKILQINSSIDSVFSTKDLTSEYKNGSDVNKALNQLGANTLYNEIKSLSGNVSEQQEFLNNNFLNNKTNMQSRQLDKNRSFDFALFTTSYSGELKNFNSYTPGVQFHYQTKTDSWSSDGLLILPNGSATNQSIWFKSNSGSYTQVVDSKNYISILGLENYLLKSNITTRNDVNSDSQVPSSSVLYRLKEKVNKKIDKEDISDAIDLNSSAKVASSKSVKLLNDTLRSHESTHSSLRSSLESHSSRISSLESSTIKSSSITQSIENNSSKIPSSAVVYSINNSKIDKSNIDNYLTNYNYTVPSSQLLNSQISRINNELSSMSSNINKHLRKDISDTMEQNLTVKGTIYCHSDITAFSDIRLKEDLQPIENALEKVNQLHGVTFHMKESKDNKRRTGLIAQEVLEVLPEAVTKDENGYYSLAYGNLVGLLVEAIKELKKEIEELKYGN